MEVESKLKQRGAWGQWSEFFFAYLGAMVGYGNIWRFPYVCYRNGGGAFLVPFVMAIIGLGIPITFLETQYSQYSNYGPGRVWEVCPLFKGIGLCMMMNLSVGVIYYQMIIAWTALYFVNSFSDHLPWTSCDNDWNTDNCTHISWETEINGTKTASDSVMASVTKDNATDSYLTAVVTQDDASVSSAEEFWFNKVLGVSSGIGELGVVRWELVLCLLATWIVTCLCLIRSIRSIGKIAYVAATLPYIILTCLLIRGSFLEGFGKGLYFFLVPRWELLASFRVWRDAVTQTFYSVGLAAGITSTLASYNKFHNNCLKDAILMPILDTLTSLFAGMITFGYLGYTAFLTNKGMDDVVRQGPGLIFMAYPTALSTLPLPQLWSVLFFLMLFVMGLDSQFVCVETVATAVVDCYPRFLPKKLHVTVCICCAGFLLGLPLTTQAGVYILNLVDWYMASISLMFSSLLEMLVLAWIYGTDRLFSDAEQMIGYRPRVAFKYIWRYIAPVIIGFLWITGFVSFESVSTQLSGFNKTSDMVGVFIAICPVMAVPLVAIYVIRQTEGPLLKRIKTSLKPTPMWRPAVYDVVDDDQRKRQELSIPL